VVYDSAMILFQIVDHLLTIGIAAVVKGLMHFHIPVVLVQKKIVVEKGFLIFGKGFVVIDDPIKVKNRIHLPTHLMRKNEKRDVLYKFYKSKKRGWLIYDVDILGVSIIQTYRTQFSGILKENSFDVLLEKLKSSDNE